MANGVPRTVGSRYYGQYNSYLFYIIDEILIDGGLLTEDHLSDPAVRNHVTGSLKPPYWESSELLLFFIAGILLRICWTVVIHLSV